VSHPLYICKHNLQAAIDKEDCGLIAGIHNLAEVWVTHINIQLWKETLSADFYTCDIKRITTFSGIQK
jgi:hypothetical protein